MRVRERTDTEGAVLLCGGPFDDMEIGPGWTPPDDELYVFNHGSIEHYHIDGPLAWWRGQHQF